MSIDKSVRIYYKGKESETQREDLRSGEVFVIFVFYWGKR